VLNHAVNCVLLADRHHGLTEGVRGLLATMFDAVAMVADETSLFESTERLKPTVAVVDVLFVPGGNLQWVARLRAAWRREGLLDARLRVLRHGGTARL